MKVGLLIRLFVCVAALCLFLYLYINQQNAITRLRKQIPALSHEVQQIKQEVVRIQFEVDQFESPLHLMELARQPEYSHLKHPCIDEIITIKRP